MAEQGFTIHIEGVPAMMLRLRAAVSASVFWAPMQRSVSRIHGDAATYPPAPPGSTYIRTGTLGRRWTTQVSTEGNDVIGIVGNKTTYGPYVMGDDLQARVHRGRWRTMGKLAEAHMPAILEDFRTTLQDALGG